MTNTGEAALAPERQKLVVNVGCGPARQLTRSPLFEGWRHLRVDIDESVDPDIIADLTDLSPIRDNIADAVWSSHCVRTSLPPPSSRRGGRVLSHPCRRWLHSRAQFPICRLLPRGSSRINSTILSTMRLRGRLARTTCSMVSVRQSQAAKPAWRTNAVSHRPV